MQERDIFLITRRDQIAFHHTAHANGRLEAFTATEQCHQFS